MIIIKTPEQIEGIRLASRLTADVLEMITPFVVAGVNTQELDERMNTFIINELGAISACIGYHGYPKYTCISVNHVICHGIPSLTKILKNGDILNIDVSIIKNSYFGDTSRMFGIGRVPIMAQKLVDVTYECMMLGIEAVKPNAPFNDIGIAIQKHAQKHNFSVVRDFCGHGVGVAFHEDPQVMHYDSKQSTDIMQEGMIFTIEPMINVGKYHSKVLADGWTAVTKDHSLSAQWEHAVLVTATGYEILSLPSKL
ncbi:methionine aminopeptidase [Gammaproteobacteria bacterium]|nr:methionine aminopeptidase [Gammaproteobacteria bacterium]